MKRNTLSVCIIFILVFSVCFFISLENIFCETFEFRLPFVEKTKINTGSSYHTGLSSEALDFGLAYGQEIYAAGDGKVITASYGWNDGFGNLIKIQHPNGYISIYAHLSEIFVSVGENVKKGQLIGHVGNSGNVWPKPTSENSQAGKHLHFEIRDSNNQSIKISSLMSGISGLNASGTQNCFQVLKELEQEKEKVTQKYNENITQVNQKSKQIDEEFKKAEQKYEEQIAEIKREWELLDEEWKTGWISKIFEEYKNSPDLIKKEDELIRPYHNKRVTEINQQGRKNADEYLKASQKYNEQKSQIDQERNQIVGEYNKKLNEINVQKDKILQNCN